MTIRFIFRFISECSRNFRWRYMSMKILAFCWMLCYFNYQKSFLNVFSKRSIWSSLVTNSLTCLNCRSSFLVTKKNFETRCVETRSCKSLIKFVIDLFVYIFSLNSSNLEYFSSVCCIVCLDESQRQFEEFATSILYK
jgi:hypothetical protein